jgi:hypothetical protein
MKLIIEITCPYCNSTKMTDIHHHNSNLRVKNDEKDGGALYCNNCTKISILSWTDMCPQPKILNEKYTYTLEDIFKDITIEREKDLYMIFSKEGIELYYKWKNNLI